MVKLLLAKFCVQMRKVIEGIPKFEDWEGNRRSQRKFPLTERFADAAINLVVIGGHSDGFGTGIKDPGLTCFR